MLLIPDQIRLHVSQSQIFSGFEKPFNEARFVVFGVPFDKTSTYRAGSKFAPSAIREASLNIETYSPRSKFDLEDVGVCDIGDLHVVDAVDETMRRLSAVESGILSASKIPVALGGEHTISYGTIRSFPKDVGVACFDAHADMRDEYMGEKLMHATFLRRVIEMLGPDRVVHIGLRALCKEELRFIKKSQIQSFSMNDLKRHDVKENARIVRRALSDFKKLYVTIDMDVLDPGFAPGVGNPEPDGMWPDLFFSIVTGICDERLAGLDLVELSPEHDSGITAPLAAKTIFEAICATEAARSKAE
ncbi:MAG: agmatinase [Candidatus Bathyarchaeia archaeon]